MNAQIKLENSLIRDFMGTYEASDYHGKPATFIFGTPKRTQVYAPLKYHRSWDWLMPVVHKILIEWIPESGGWPHEYTLLQKMLLGSRIKQVYTAVVEFIKWYNSTLK